MGFFSWLFKKKEPKKIKLGLALGSGGAKGFAHLGVLKAFEEAGIEFDMVAGTSIGSVVGAFYSAGYSSTDMDELLGMLNFGEITNKFLIKMDTTGMVNVVDREIGYKKIEELKKPFCAVATEVDSGDPHVFKSGRVADAVCASSCIPPFFKPVLIDGVRYVDGAFSNSVPADVVKEMGADYVVGVDLSTRESKPTLLSKVLPTYPSKVKEPWSKGYEYSDTIMHPDLNEYSSVDIKNRIKMYEVGYNHALTFIPKIKEDIYELTYGKPKKKEKIKKEKVKKEKKIKEKKGKNPKNSETEKTKSEQIKKE